MLLVLLMPVAAAPLHSQSTQANSAPDSRQQANPSPQETTQPAAVEAKAALSPAATPEQIRQAQIEADTKKLYQLSAELRAEVSKTYKESLSLTVLKKAEEVESAAKSLRMLMSKEAAARH
jgi:biopolymer transport protein ExbD